MDVTSVSAGFLYLIGVANFMVFRSLWLNWRQSRAQSRSDQVGNVPAVSNAVLPVNAEPSKDEILWKRGFFNRLLHRPLRMIEHAWQTYFIGLLFGLGFDTATEVGLLAVSGAAVNRGTPAVDTLVLQLLFAAGMSLVDGIDGVMMMHAYKWTFQKKGRRMVYNLVITGLSVVIAAVVGTWEWIHMILP